MGKNGAGNGGGLSRSIAAKMTKKVALVYDWADTNFGGAERVLLKLQKTYPQADLITAFVDWQKAKWLENFPVVKTSFLQKWPRWLKRKKFWLAPFLPMAFESFDLREYDLIISVASFAAKGVLTAPSQKHLCYLLTPTRFLYSHAEQYQNKVERFFARPISKYLKRWEQVAIWRPDKVATISKLVAERTEEYYGRKPDAVIYPLTVDKKFFTKKQNKEILAGNPYFLCVSRLVKYKKIDVVIRACKNLKVSLKIIGTGPEEKNLRQLAAGVAVEFLGNVSEKELLNCYNRALALLAPGEEDFGINILEANAAGCWVIANGKSGAMELLNSRQALPVTGQTVKALTVVMTKFLEEKMWQEAVTERQDDAR